MKLFTDLFSHLFLWGLVVVAGLAVLFMALGILQIVGEFLLSIFYPLYAVTLKPIVWVISTIFGSRCPQCGGFFKKQFIKNEVIDEAEVLQTVNRVDRGILYPNKLFARNQGFEVTRQEQVSVVEQTIRRHWTCKNSTCGHHWYVDEYMEYEGRARDMK